MALHMGILLSIMFTALQYSKSKHTWHQKRKCVAGIVIIMTLFSGLRTWAMGDLPRYYMYYLRLTGSLWQETAFSDWTNIGLHLFFHYVGGVIGVGYQGCLFIIAAFSAITLGVLVYRFSPSPYWSFLMYITMGFYFFTFSGLKQTVAMGFLVLAMTALLDDKPVKFVIMTVLGGLFHAPAFIFLIAYPFSRKRVDALYFLYIVTLFAVVLVFRNQIVRILYSMYYDDMFDVEPYKLVGGRLLMLLFIFALSVLLRPLRQRDAVYRKVFNVMVFGAIMQMFSVFSDNFSRLADYYVQFIVLFVPLMMEDRRFKPKKLLMGAPRFSAVQFSTQQYLLMYATITAFSLWFYFDYISGSPAKDILNYKFLWQLDAYSLYGSQW